jgi:PKHD-type hydroxylase
MICISGLLNTAELGKVTCVLAAARFVDGRGTAGSRAAQVKHNEQLATDDPVRPELEQLVLDRLANHPLVDAYALPSRFSRPMFSRYRSGMRYGLHTDDALMGADRDLRTDLAYTLFLSAPRDYDGGELVIHDASGERELKLDGGSVVVYPATELHRVSEVTRGERLAAVGWLQSHVRNVEQRSVLFELQSARAALSGRQYDTAVDCVARTHSNLLRIWAGS